MRWSAGPSSRCQPEMWETMSRALHVPSHTWRMWSSLRPESARLNFTNSASASFSSVVFSDMFPSRAAGRDALVEEELAHALGQVVDVAARREAERGVHPDRGDVRLLGRGEQARVRRHHLYRLEELARDTLAAEILAHHGEGDERALEPVHPVGQEAHDLALGLGHDQVMALEV